MVGAAGGVMLRDLPLKPETLYCFRVAALNHVGASEYSGVSKFATSEGTGGDAEGDGDLPASVDIASLHPHRLLRIQMSSWHCGKCGKRDGGGRARYHCGGARGGESDEGEGDEGKEGKDGKEGKEGKGLAVSCSFDVCGACVVEALPNDGGARGTVRGGAGGSGGTGRAGGGARGGDDDGSSPALSSATGTTGKAGKTGKLLGMWRERAAEARASGRRRSSGEDDEGKSEGKASSFGDHNGGGGDGDGAEEGDGGLVPVVDVGPRLVFDANDMPSVPTRICQVCLPLICLYTPFPLTHIDDTTHDTTHDVHFM